MSRSLFCLILLSLLQKDEEKRLQEDKRRVAEERQWQEKERKDREVKEAELREKKAKDRASQMMIKGQKHLNK